MDQFKSLKIKFGILLFVIILASSVLLSLQYNKYKNIVGLYDIRILSHLENEMERMIVLTEQGELTQEVYTEKRRNLQGLSTLLGTSPNIGFMSNHMYRVIGKSEMNEMDDLNVLQIKLESIFKDLELTNSDDLYNYFNDEKNSDRFMMEMRDER
jgi:hypothetical protein